MDVWFSPHKLIRDYLYLSEEERKAYSADEQKIMKEAFHGSIMLLGVMKAQRREYWIQLVDPSEQTPDLRTMRLRSRPNQSDWMDVQDLEVVEYEDHSTETIDEFLKRTKLSPRKRYPAGTSILCFLNKTMSMPNWSVVHKSLKDLKNSIDTYIVGSINETKLDYFLAKINPLLEITQFNASEAAATLCTVHTRKVSRGSKKQERELDQQFFPFWEIK